MRVLVPTLCGQGQVYSNFWLSTIEVMKQSMTYNSNVYREVEASIRNQIASLIPDFDPMDKKFHDMVNGAMAQPDWQQRFHLEYNAKSVDIAFYALNGESLLARARNHAAQIALTQGYDRILFIDADEGFSWPDVLTLVLSPYPVSAGLVPLKTYVNAQHETPLNFLPFVEDECFFDDSLRTLKSTIRMARAHKSDWIKVAFTGTGFLCVDVQVFRTLAETEEEYIFPDPGTKMPMVHWSFFDGGPINDRYFSEDWVFIEKCRRIGHDIMVNVNVRANHMGPHTFIAQ